MKKEKIKPLNTPVYTEYLIEDLDVRVAIEQLEERIEMVGVAPECWECTKLCFGN